VAGYEIRFTGRADTQLRKLDRIIQRRLSTAIDDLRVDPRPHGAKMLAGVVPLWRIRVGSYRVVYTVEDDILLVLVVKLGHRRSVYRDL
jgi:mRNA interferase RelE/StbE